MGEGPSSAYNIQWSQDDKQLLVTSDDGNDGLVFLWNITTGQRTLAITVPAYATSTYSVQLSPDGKYLLSIGTNGTSNPTGTTLDLWRMPV